MKRFTFLGSQPLTPGFMFVGGEVRIDQRDAQGVASRPKQLLEHDESGSASANDDDVLHDNVEKQEWRKFRSAPAFTNFYKTDER